MIYVTDIHPLVFWSSDRKQRLGKRARRIFQEVERGKHSIIVPVAVILLESVALVAIHDPADRAIVATARHLRCPLITVDEGIRDGKWVDTVWE